MAEVNEGADTIVIQRIPQTQVKGADSALSFARSIVVTNNNERDLALVELRSVKSRYTAVEEMRVKFVKPLNDHVKMINDEFRGPLAALKMAEDTLKRTITAFDEEQERIAEEARRKAAAEAERIRLDAERKAREAKEKAEAEERRKREEEERQRKAADEAAAAAMRAREAAAEATNKRDRERLEREAAEQEAKRREAEAGEIRAREQARKAAEDGERKAQAALEAIELAPQPALVEHERAAGTSARVTYKAEVVDIIALARAVAEGKVPPSAITGNEKELNKIASALKDEMPKFYPGTKVIRSTGMAVRK